MNSDDETFTFLLHGTMYHEQSRVQSLIGPIAEALKQKNMRIINGPGSVGDIGEGGSAATGTYYYDPRTGRKVRKEVQVPNLIAQVVGAVAGYGVEDNLIEMLDVIIRQSPRVKKINCLGFSRGADTALRFANLINQFIPDIEVNIMAVEPVAGPGRGADKASCNIPPNVKNYVSTLAMHEGRAGFSPQDYSRINIENHETNVELLPLPGEHGMHARLYADKKATQVVSELVTDLAVQKLNEWGSTMDKHPGYSEDPRKSGEASVVKQAQISNDSDLSMLKKYAQMVLKPDVYGDAAKSRFFVRHALDYSPVLPEYFLNTHHLRLFANKFPNTFEHIKDPSNYHYAEAANKELKGHDDIRLWIKNVGKDYPRVFFDINKDSLDGNYRCLMMGVHHWREERKKEKEYLKKNDEEQLKASRQLISAAKALLVSDLEPKQKERDIKSLYESYIKKDPDSQLSKALKKSFAPMDPAQYTLLKTTLHHIRAAKNLNTYTRITHEIKMAVFVSYQKYHEEIKNTLDEAIGRFEKLAGDGKANDPVAIAEVVNTARQEILKHDNNFYGKKFLPIFLNRSQMRINVISNLDRLSRWLTDKQTEHALTAVQDLKK